MALTPFTLPLRGVVPNQRARKVDLEAGINSSLAALNAAIGLRALRSELDGAINALGAFVGRIQPGNSFRPGHHPESFQSALNGDPDGAPQLPVMTLQTVAGLGKSLIMTGPQMIAVREPIAIVPGRIYRVSVAVRRVVNPPALQNVRATLAILNASFGLIDEVEIDANALVAASGVWRADATLSLSSPVAGVDVALPSDAVYVRPVFRTEGIGHQTACGQIDWKDITEAASIDGALDAVALAAAVTAAQAAEAAADGHADRAEDAADRAEAAAAAFPSPVLLLANTPTENADEIQALLDTTRLVRLPSNREIVVNRSLFINPWNLLTGDPTSVLKLADGSFAPLIMNRNAIAHAPGASGRTFTTPNPYMLDFAGDAQARTQAVFLDELYNYNLANAYTVVAGDTVTMSDGLRYWVAPPDANYTPIENKNAVKFIPARDIASGAPGTYTPRGTWGPRWRFGIAGGLVLDHNGNNNRVGSAQNNEERWRDYAILWQGAQGLICEALVRNSARWGCQNRDVVDAEFRMDYDQPAALEDEVSPEEEGFTSYGNKDGLDFTSGCHRIVVWSAKGRSNDDCIALNVLYDKHDPAYDHRDPFDLYPRTMSFLNPRYPFYGPQSDDVSKITIMFNGADPRGSHHWYRILPGGWGVGSNGRKVSQIQIVVQSDITDPEQLVGNIYSRQWQATAVGLLGDANFDPAPPEAISDITMTDLTGTARRMLEFRGSASRVTANRIMMAYRTSVGSDAEGDEEDDEAFTQTAVVLMGVNDPFEQRTYTATEGEDTFVTPPFYRLATTAEDLAWSASDDKIFVTWTAHGNELNFRGLITFLDGGGDPILDRSYTWRVEDANTLWAFIGAGWVFPVNGNSGTCDLRRNAIIKPGTRRLGTVWEVTGDVRIRRGNLNNGTLRVTVNGTVLADDQYTEITSGNVPENTQLVELLVPRIAGDVVVVERFPFPRSYRLTVDNLDVGQIKGGGDKPTNSTDPARAPLQWGHGIDIRRGSLLRDSSIRNIDMAFCRHVVEVWEGAAMQGTTISNVRLREVGQQPLRFRPGCDVGNCFGNEIRDIRVDNRESVFVYNTTDDPLSPNNGLIYSGRLRTRFSGSMPPVLPVDSFPIWARDGSRLPFAANTFQANALNWVLPFGVTAMKVGDWNGSGDTGRWVAVETEDGLPLTAVMMPCAMGTEGDGTYPETPAGPLRVVSGQRFSAASPPPDGYRIRIKPPATNSGSFGVQVDDMSSIAARCSMPSRAADALPAGYLRPGTATTLTWDATGERWLVDRHIERVSDAGWTADLHEDGQLEIRHRPGVNLGSSTADGSLFYSDGQWVVPVAAQSTLIAHAMARSTVSRWANVRGALSSGEMTVRQMGAANSATTTSVDITARGFWW